MCRCGRDFCLQLEIYEVTHLVLFHSCALGKGNGGREQGTPYFSHWIWVLRRDVDS